MRKPMESTCPSEYIGYPVDDRRCVRGGHGHDRRPEALHYNRAGDAWTDADATEAARRATAPTMALLGGRFDDAKRLLAEMPEDQMAELAAVCANLIELAQDIDAERRHEESQLGSDTSA